jgi:hypothetical protein
MLPFDQRDFFDLFERYNEATWPIQLFAYALGAAAASAIFFRHRSARVICLGVLASLWAWTAGAYHWLFFTSINPLATVFGALFATQAVIFAVAATQRKPAFAVRTRMATVIGWSLIGYAAVLYPAINAALGHGYPAGPSLGVTPCPLVIFTFGIFLLSTWRVPWLAFVIPVIWSVVGGSAALLLGVVTDLALPVAAAMSLALNTQKPSGPCACLT